jgi:hypothetical protein
MLLQIQWNIKQEFVVILDTASIFLKVMKMEAVWSTEDFVSTYKPTRRYNKRDQHLHSSTESSIS